MKVVLASASPRRLALLEQVGIKAKVCPADFDEEAGGAETAQAVALHNALGKCSHQVLTGVAVRYQGKEIAKVCATKVCFRQLTEAEIAAYVATGEPLDKAGAYGIQGKGALLVEKIEGCYNNVVGLPLTMLYSMLKELGVSMIA